MSTSPQVCPEAFAPGVRPPHGTDDRRSPLFRRSAAVAMLLAACLGCRASAQTTRPATAPARSRLASPLATAGMLSKLRSAEARDRVEAAMALGSETPPGRIVLVREALREAATGDLEPEVRQRATEALRALRQDWTQLSHLPGKNCRCRR